MQITAGHSLCLQGNPPTAELPGKSKEIKLRHLNMVFAMLVILFAPSVPLHAQTTCNMDALKGQQRDVATI